MNSVHRPLRPLVLTGLLMLVPVAFAQHEGDVWVGVSGADQLKRGGFDDFVNIVKLEPTDGGFLGNNPGFDHIVNPNVDDDLFPLESGVQVRLELVAADPAISGIQVGTFLRLENPGDSVLLRPSGPVLHEHLLWFIDSESPGFDPQRKIWRATFMLTDTGSTQYATSESFSIMFTNQDLLLGDMNCDGAVTVSDINGFVAALVDPPAYALQFPDCAAILADMNDDERISVGDIGGFVDALTGGA